MSSSGLFGIPAASLVSMCTTGSSMRSRVCRPQPCWPAHAAHIAETIGPEHVACGFDFCEYFGPGNEGCEGMENCAQTGNFFFELERLGFSAAERQGITSENLLRVLE